MKTKRIILHKDQLLYDIEAIAFKTADALGLEGKQKNVVSANHEKTLDGRILARYMDLRDARLRRRLRFCLACLTQDVACDNPSERKEYIYDLNLSSQFDDNMLEVVKTDMHDYVVKGTLYDWYRHLGSQSAISDAELREIEEGIVSVLRTPSYLKAPLQPFGPAKKIV